MQPADVYLHGTSDEEQERLALMNGLLNGPALAELELSAGERVLDLGAGTGLFAAEMARVVGPRGLVVAVERDARQASAARANAARVGPWLEVREGSAYEPPLAPAEWGSFDVVHARFLLEHLDHPARAVAPMVRAARPGGRIVLIDDDHSLMRFEPDPLGMRDLWDDYCALYERLGKDPWIGRKLVKLLADAGARPQRVAWIQYGGCSGQPSFPGLVENLAQVLEGVRAPLVEAGWTGERFDAALAAFRAWGARGDAALWYPLPCAIAQRP